MKKKKKTKNVFKLLLHHYMIARTPHTSIDTPDLCMQQTWKYFHATSDVILNDITYVGVLQTPTLAAIALRPGFSFRHSPLPPSLSPQSRTPLI